MDSAVIATLISSKRLNKNIPNKIDCTISLTLDQAKLIQEAIEKGKKIELTITD